MKSLKWTVLSIKKTQLFLRVFPLMGGIVKIHRPLTLPDTDTLIGIIKKYKVRTLVIEPIESQDEQQLFRWCRTMSKHVRINTSPFLPTKTIRIDLTSDEETIFHTFSEAKRRAVRRAQKNGVTIIESNSIENLIRIKNKSGGFFGFIATTGVKELWPIFAPKNASIVLAHDSKGLLIGGVLLLHYDSRSYYWVAGATKYGKKLAAPTLLVWDAIKISKKMKSKTFDFVGVWDERIPKENTQWLGFTKFKEGFGGSPIYYPLVPNK